MEQVQTTCIRATDASAGQGLPARPRSARPAVIVLDAGPAAWVATRELPGEVGIGTRLTFHGASWRVVAYRPHARAYVAEPSAS
jgi:hypothetical protein